MRIEYPNLCLGALSMLFSSVGFLFRFLPVFMLIYLIVPAKFRNIVLLAGSLVFYGVGEPYFVLLLVFSVLINFGFSRYMFWEPRSPQQNRKKKRARRRKVALTASLVIDFGLLFVLKVVLYKKRGINELSFD